MNVTLPSTLEEFARRKVAAGEFVSVDEVVCEGLRLLQEREQWKEATREKIEVGWQQAKTGQLQKPQQVRANLVARKNSWRNSQPQ